MLWQSRGWNTAGVDINRDNIEIARTSNVDARFCDLNRDPLPFGDGDFDLIFAGEVIGHLVDTDGFLAEVRRSAAPNFNLCTDLANHSLCR